MAEEPNKKQCLERKELISQAVARFKSFDSTLFKLSVSKYAHEMHDINIVWIARKTNFGVNFETHVAVAGPDIVFPTAKMIVDFMLNLDPKGKLFFAGMQIQIPMRNRDTHTLCLSRAQQFIDFKPDNAMLSEMLIVHTGYALCHFLPTSRGEITAIAKNMGMDVQWDLEYFDQFVECIVLHECLSLESALHNAFEPDSGRKSVSCFLAQLSQQEAVLYYK